MDMEEPEPPDDSSRVALEVAEHEGGALKYSTITGYATAMKSFEEYLENRINIDRQSRLSNTLLNPRIEPIAKHEWLSAAGYKANPIEYFKKRPCNIDWRNFNIQEFKLWMKKKQETPKANGHYPSNKKLSKAPCAVKYYCKNAMLVSRGRIAENLEPPIDLVDKMKVRAHTS